MNTTTTNILWFDDDDAVLHIFVGSFLDKVSLRPNFHRTRCPSDAKTVGHQTCRKHNPWLWTKQEKLEVHMTDNQTWNSCRKVASDHELTFGSATEPAENKHNALWPCTIHGHLLQPEHGASVVRMYWSTRLSFVLNRGLSLVGK